MPISSLIVTGESDLPETHLLIGLFRAGIVIEVLCSPSARHRSLLVDAGIPVFDLSLKSRFDREGMTIIRDRLRTKKFDIVHAFNNKALSNALAATKGHSIKVIAYRGIEGNVSYLDPLSWLTYLHPRVSRIVCVADAIKKYFWNMRLLGLKLPVTKAVTIYKGHNPDWYQSSVPLDRFDIPKNSFVVGCTVNDRPRKGLSYLIEATHQIPKNLPIHFVLIGNIGSKKLLSSIKKSSYSNNIHLLGFQKEAAAIIRNCDVCILPAVKREGLPKAIIEGMIQGVAPVVTDSGGSPELIDDGQSGIIIKPRSSKAIADAIMKLYEDRELLQKVQIEAKKQIANSFCIEKTVQQHVELYENITSVGS